MKKISLLFITIAALSVILSLPAYRAFASSDGLSPDAVIADGITIGGIDVSGKTVTEADSLISERINPAYGGYRFIMG